MSEAANPRYQGIAIAAGFWWCGVVAWSAPVYIGLDGLSKWVLNVVGAGLIVIAFAAAVLELGNLWKNEAFTYWGLGLLALIPAGLLHALAWLVDVPSPWMGVVKGCALFLDALGGFVFLFGVAYWGTPRRPEDADEQPPEEEAEVRQKRQELFWSAAVLLVTIVTAILKAVFGIG